MKHIRRGYHTYHTLVKHIQIKEEVARDQDKAVLPILRRTLEEKSKT